MLAQHPQSVADGREIELRVAGFEFVHELEQRLGAGRFQGDAEFGRTRDEQSMFGLSCKGWTAQGLGGLSRIMDKTISARGMAACPGSSSKRPLKWIAPS